VLLDLADLRKYQVATFMTGFLETLYRLKNREEYRTPMMLVIDEADAIAPQRPMKGEERMLGAAEDIVRRGGQRGIGITMVTQRAAVLNKNVLSQCGILIFLRTLGLQDIDGVNDWINKHGQPEQRALLMKDLASLPRGTAWFWAPGWPDERGIFKKIVVDPIETFDSGATPKPGEKRIAPKTVADVDLEAFRKDMAATIEKAKAEDPRELQRQVRDLQKKLQDAQRSGVKPQHSGPAPQPKRVEVPVLKDAQVKRLEVIFHGAEKLQERTAAALAELVKAAWAARDTIRSHQAGDGSRYPVHLSDVVRSEAVSLPRKVRISPQESGNFPQGPGKDLPGPQRKLLTALAQHGERSKTALALLTGYAHTGGAFRNPLSALRSSGYVDGLDMLRITEAGLTALGSWTPLPTGRDLLEWWLNHLPGPETKLLRVVAGRYPKPINVEELSLETEYEVTGGAFRNPLSRLRTLQLIAGRGEVRAAEELFT